MSKKGYPGLVLVPPSDRTIVRRRIVRWSLISLAIVWGLFTFISSLAPSSKNDCPPVGTQTAPSTTQADCNQVTTSVQQPQPRLEKTPPMTEGPVDVSPADGQSSLTSPSSEVTKPTSEQTTEHPVSINPSTAQTTADGNTVLAQPDGGLIADPSPNQSTRPNTVPDHKTVTQAGNGTASQHPLPPAHITPDYKPTAQSGTGSAPTSSSHHPVKSVSSAVDHKVVTQAAREPAAPSTPNQSTKMGTPASSDHKLPGQSGQGAAPTQTNTKPVIPSAHAASDRKLPAQSGNGVGQSQTSQPAKSVSPADHKQIAQSHNGSVPHQTPPQAVTSKPSSLDRKVSAHPGNSSTNSPHQMANTNSVAGQSGNGASSHHPPASDYSQDARLAEEGDAFAQYRLGRFYAQQGGRQMPEAVKWYKRASTGLRRLAEAGNGQAMYILGVMYAYGRGVAQNTHEARLWLSQAVDRKVSAAHPVLASLEKDRSVAHTTR